MQNIHEDLLAKSTKLIYFSYETKLRHQVHYLHIFVNQISCDIHCTLVAFYASRHTATLSERQVQKIRFIYHFYNRSRKVANGCYSSSLCSDILSESDLEECLYGQPPVLFGGLVRTASSFSWSLSIFDGGTLFVPNTNDI